MKYHVFGTFKCTGQEVVKTVEADSGKEALALVAANKPFPIKAVVAIPEGAIFTACEYIAGMPS